MGGVHTPQVYGVARVCTTQSNYEAVFECLGGMLCGVGNVISVEINMLSRVVHFIFIFQVIQFLVIYVL